MARSAHWIKGQRHGSVKNKKRSSIYQPDKIGGPHIIMYGPDPETGMDILWQTDDDPGTVKEISQCILFDGRGQITHHIPIPTEFKTGRELVNLFAAEGVGFPIPRVLVIASSGDEDRVQAILKELGIEIELTRRSGGGVPRQVIRVESSHAYFRTLAKIGFHYALRYISTISGSEEAFFSIRQFIIKGIGDYRDFLTECDTIRNPTGPPGHMLSAIAVPNNPILVNMQFFAGCEIALPQWSLALGNNPTTLFIKQTSAHFFSYAMECDGRLVGGDAVAMSIADSYAG